MSKRKNDKPEIIEPAINGLEALAINIPLPEPLITIEEEQEKEPAIPENDGQIEPVILTIGASPEACALATLASSCGWDVEAAAIAEESSLVESFPYARKIIDLESLENIVRDCQIERNFFVCIFLNDNEDCELVLSQCMASDAWYIGLAGGLEKRNEVFSALREDGEPDAELAAIAAPMGLNIGASGPQQEAVAIMAEMLAAKAGKLKRLRH